METLENGLQTHSGVSLQSCTTTLHFIWSNIADVSLTLVVNGPQVSLHSRAMVATFMIRYPRYITQHNS